MNDKEMIEIYHIASTIAPCNVGDCGKCRIRCTYSLYAEKIYNAGYRPTFTSAFASDTQKAFKEGYQKAQAEAQAYADIMHKQDEEIAQLRIELLNKEKAYDDLIKSDNKLFKRFEKERGKIRKETAKEFAKKFTINLLNNSVMDDDCKLEELKFDGTEIRNALNDTLKQFGGEVEE